ncbi:hypothetical protein [Nitrosococcus halophilus]|uniref:hypothetical protein n=1 Tax=Nitrosococcus halophilus TaxID=133539 RepID=UPI001EF06555|nr:hypothetical protein [Nitrosococcus halophilus]
MLFKGVPGDVHLNSNAIKAGPEILSQRRTPGTISCLLARHTRLAHSLPWRLLHFAEQVAPGILARLVAILGQWRGAPAPRISLQRQLRTPRRRFFLCRALDSVGFLAPSRRILRRFGLPPASGGRRQNVCAQAAPSPQGCAGYPCPRLTAPAPASARPCRAASSGAVFYRRRPPSAGAVRAGGPSWPSAWFRGRPARGF